LTAARRDIEKHDVGLPCDNPFQKVKSEKVFIARILPQASIYSQMFRYSICDFRPGVAGAFRKSLYRSKSSAGASFSKKLHFGSGRRLSLLKVLHQT
jgi:hypothetical protein